MKISSFAVAFTLLATPALVAPATAGEGNGNPFPLTTNGINTTMTAGKIGSSQNPFPYTAAGTTTTWVAGKVGSSQNPFPYTASSTSFATGPAVDTGSERPVQSAQAPARGLAPTQRVVR